jgi:hypothetical protein
MLLRHATLRRNVFGIERNGLLIEMDKVNLPAEKLCHECRTARQGQ